MGDSAPDFWWIDVNDDPADFSLDGEVKIGSNDFEDEGACRNVDVKDDEEERECRIAGEGRYRRASTGEFVTDTGAEVE